MSKKPKNLDEKWEILRLLDEGFTPSEVSKRLRLKGRLNAAIAWLLLNGFIQRIAQGRYKATKHQVWHAPPGVKAKLLGEYGGVFVVSRPHPLSREQLDYVGLVLGADSLGVKTEGLLAMLQLLKLYPTAVPLTAINLRNLQAAVGRMK
jgi:hypothetical protein